MGVERLAQFLVDNRPKVEDHSNLISGVVTSTAPLKIKVENRYEIQGDMISLSAAVKSLTVPVRGIDGSGYAQVFEDLKVGEKVAMVKAQGSQRYIVLDRR